MIDLPEMEGPGDDTVTGGYDLDQITPSDLYGRDLVRRKSDKVSELRWWNYMSVLVSPMKVSHSEQLTRQRITDA